MQAAKALREKAAREDKIAAALLKRAPVGTQLEFTYAGSVKKLSKNSREAMKDKRLTIEDSSIQLQGNANGCPGDVLLKVN